MTQGKDFGAVPFHLFRCLLIIRLPRRLLANNFRSSLDEGRLIRSDPSSFALSGPVNKRHIGDEGDAKTHRTPKVIADYGRYRKVKLDIVLEVAFNSIQFSLARVTPPDSRCVFLRIKAIQRDKNVDCVDTLQYARSFAKRDAQIHRSILPEARK